MLLHIFWMGPKPEGDGEKDFIWINILPFLQRNTMFMPLKRILDKIFIPAKLLTQLEESLQLSHNIHLLLTDHRCV